MITYFTFEPDYFNNNGDQGNIEVLLHFLKHSGQKVKRVDSPKDADFVLIGDGSLAVVEHFSKKLGALRNEIKKRFDAGKPTLIVGSSFEFFAEQLGLSAEKTARKSGFVRTAEGYFGYRNSDSNLPEVLVKGSFIATKLFGPVLAKNPQLLKLQMDALGAEFVMSDEIARWIEIIRQKSD
jgi:CobQ-like glutamine amidotransferase family enzyme